MIIPNDRWESPFPHTIAFELFRLHFTELNNIYWAHVPAANTIIKKAKEALPTDSDDPKSYFLIPDVDDRRIALSYSQWKSDYGEFQNYTRLNMVMLLSSSFETYLRTVISLSFESKPGILIHCPDAVDGVFLLREDKKYGEYGSNDYQFKDEIESVCKGEWSNRIASYIKFFGSSPLSNTEIEEIDNLRKDRNLIGHYFGREKKLYETPLLTEPSPVHRVSHAKLVKYLSTVFTVVEKIDSHLHKAFIGSYDIIKYCFNNFETDSPEGDQARELKRTLGKLGFPIVGLNYYRNIISYISLPNEAEPCKYSKRSCVCIINDELAKRNITLYKDNRPIPFSNWHLSLFVRSLQLKGNPDFCMARERKGTYENYYSIKLIELIINKICDNPDGIIGDLLDSGSQNGGA